MACHSRRVIAATVIPGDDMSKRYQSAPTDVSESAWRRGFMTPLEVFRSAAWKSALGLGELSLNTEEEFEVVTGEAMDHIRSWRGRSLVGVDNNDDWIDWHATARSAIGSNYVPRTGLMRLNGVSYPMATALLCVLDPTVWPVMDRWAVQSVFGLRLDGRQFGRGEWQKATVYASYARHLATTGAQCWPDAVTIHELDQAAMGASMPATGGRPAGVLPPDWVTTPLPR